MTHMKSTRLPRTGSANNMRLGCRTMEKIEAMVAEEAFDGELAAIYVLPLTVDGVLIATPGTPTPAIAPKRLSVSENQTARALLRRYLR